MGAEEFVEQHLPGYPEGEPQDIRDAASSLDALADSLQGAFGVLEGEVAHLPSSWDSPDKTAFVEEFTDFRSAVADLEHQVRDAARQLRRMADELESAQQQYRNALIEIGVSVAVGVAFSVMTFGSGSAASAALVASRVTAAVESVIALRAAAAVALRVVTTFLVYATPRLVIVGASDLTTQAVSNAITRPDHNPFKGISADQSAIAVAAALATGGASGLFGRLARNGSSLSQAGSRIAGGAIGSASFGLGQQVVAGGPISVGQVAAAAALDGVGSRTSRGGSDPFRKGVAAEGTNGGRAGLNRGLANSVIQHNGYIYRLDWAGRVARVEGSLSMGDRVRVNSNTATQVRAEGLPGDQAGHLIAKIFGGAPEAFNLVAQSGNLNMGAWRSLERKWAAALEGKPPQAVSVVIDIDYDGSSNRPVEFLVKQTVGDSTTLRGIWNAPGGLAP